MLYYRFGNYEEFKELFGMQEHGNGTKSRKNKILLAMLKDKNVFRTFAHPAISARPRLRHKKNGRERVTIKYAEKYPYDIDVMNISSMPELFTCVMTMLSRTSVDMTYFLEMHDICGTNLRSDSYKTDDFKGLCEDGDFNSFRYVKTDCDRVYKMRAGKFFRKLIEENPDVNNLLPEQVKIWVCEEFAERWKSYASNEYGGDKYTLHVDKNFQTIYSQPGFGSCMTGHSYWTFYRDSVKASAAYLRDDNGRLVARCVIFDDVVDGNDNHLRLAERQYSREGNLSLQRILIMRLIEEGRIDGYKRVGAGCHSPLDFLDTNGNRLKNLDLYIDCNLEDYSTVSYQDSFKWYDGNDMRAYNYGQSDDGNLSVTDGVIEGEDNHDGELYCEHRDEWNDEDYCYYCENTDTNEYTDDVVEIGGYFYYAGWNCEDLNEWGISKCPQCGDYFLTDDGEYSDVTDETYCDIYCLERAEKTFKEDNWYYSEYDDDYYECEYEIIEAYRWDDCTKEYKSITISQDTVDSMLEYGSIVEYAGEYYLDDVNEDGIPVHLVTENELTEINA